LRWNQARPGRRIDRDERQKRGVQLRPQAIDVKQAADGAQRAGGDDPPRQALVHAGQTG
jgi:hypothetical protein